MGTLSQMSQCSQADFEHPSQAKTHLPTLARENEHMTPGSHLTIDGSGALKGIAKLSTGKLKCSSSLIMLQATGGQSLQETRPA
jgi:hypothetical protein